MAFVTQEQTVVPAQTGRIDHIVQELTGRSRADVRGLFHEGCVRCNGAPCPEPGRPVAAGDVVVVRHDPHRRYREPPPARTSAAFQLVYEDDQLVVVDKAAHMLTVPTAKGERHTLVELVTRHMQRRHPRARACIVHRLDRGTSGLLVFARDRGIADALQEQFRQRKADREYVAIVGGRVAADSGTFETRLGTTRSLQRYSLNDDEEGGETAVTHYSVERRLKGATLVRARLETGRRNQIRVQFAEAGHPVLGDERYGEKGKQHRGWKARRLALHAAALGFVHPVTGQSLSFASPLPVEFEQFLAKSS